MRESMNEKLAEYIKLKAEIAKREKRVEEIAEELKKGTSFETSLFTVDVAPIEQMRTVSADQLCTVLDPVLVAKFELVKTIKFNKVTVKAKKVKTKAA